MAMALLSGCEMPTFGKPYELVVLNGGLEGEWTVELSQDGIVSYSIQSGERADEDIILFEGLKPGSVRATIFHGKTGAGIEAADNVYAVDLEVDMLSNVTQTDPPYGSYTIDCGYLISGGELRIELSNEDTVHWWSSFVPDEKGPNDPPEDGMSEGRYLYTFTGRHPGTVEVKVITHLPWMDGDGFDGNYVDGIYTLEVDENYKVSCTSESHGAQD